MLPRHTHSQRLRLLESCRLFEGSLARQFPTEHQSPMRLQRNFILISRCAIDVCLVILKQAAFIAANQLLAFPQSISPKEISGHFYDDCFHHVSPLTRNTHNPTREICLSLAALRQQTSFSSPDLTNAASTRTRTLYRTTLYTLVAVGGHTQLKNGIVDKAKTRL